MEPKTLSFVVTDLKTKRLAGLKKETFEDLLKSANIPGKYFCRRSFATWDVLPPSEEVAKKLAGGNITTRFFRLQPEYRGKRRIKVTVCNVSMQSSGDVLAAYIYGDVLAAYIYGDVLAAYIYGGAYMAALNKFLK